MGNKVLLEITVITDDDSGMYTKGEFGIGKTGHCEKFLEEGDNRNMFVKWLRWLADAAEEGTEPFFPHEGTAKKQAADFELKTSLQDGFLKFLADTEARTDADVNFEGKGREDT